MEQPDPRIDRRALREDPAAWSVRSKRGVVACAHYLAADAGAAVLEAGGNAADAAVAAALALNVCEPAASGLGGMAMVVGCGLGDGAPFFVDGACTAPATATPERVRVLHRYRGHGAVAVPGAPAALAALHETHGRLPIARLVEPAVALARDGYRFTVTQRDLAKSYRAAVRKGNAAFLIDRDDGQPREVGDLVVQPQLAETLAQLGRDGLMSFYDGEIAQRIAADMADHGGFVTADDLGLVRRPELRDPIAADFGTRRLFTAGPPAGGITLVQLILMTNELGWVPDPRRTRDLSLVAELIRRARRDRQRHRLTVGARDVHLAGDLLSQRMAQSAAAEAMRTVGYEPGETSHLSVMDADGGVVSMTVSIERSYGSARMHPELGFLYNGYLRGFKVENRRHPHFLRPGAPARSNAAPTIVLGQEGDAVAIGSTGSERMVSGIYTTLLRLQRESPFEAVAAPRIHCTPERRVLVEWDRLPEPSQNHLRRQYPVRQFEPYAFAFGGLQLAVRTGDEFVGVGEPRRDGGASAPGGGGGV